MPTEMIDKYLLYIDILGFADLVNSGSSRVPAIYEVVDSLNVHKHDAFSTIVFSDTILVYNKYDPSNDADHDYFVMFACEFAQDLLHRFTGKNQFFRALVTYGPFDHYNLEHTECFYGLALVDAYNKEKAIQSHGLFISDKANRHNRIFGTCRYDKDLSFVYLTQATERLLTNSAGVLPVDPIFFDDTDEGYFLLPEIRLFQDTHRLMNEHKDPKVRTKHLTAWHFYRQRYRPILDFLERNEFRPDSICPDHDWSNEVTALMRDYGCSVGPSSADK